MLTNLTKPAATALLLGALALGGATTAQAQNVAQAHMGHVSEGWNDTPDGSSPSAAAEA